MQGGHFCAGSTIANLTGIWAARDAADVKTVVTSQAAHLSVEKACRLLHLEFVKVAGRSEDNASTGSRLIGEMTMPKHRVFAIKFAGVYSLYVQKAERKNRTKQEVDQIICWLTGYDLAGLQQQIEQGSDFEAFFAQAPAIHPNSALIKGSVCGVRVEEITEPLMQKIRYLDKLIDELAKGKAMEKILRQ